jgi:hypothetical protein
VQWLKQSTAVSKIVGPILDASGVEYASAVIGDLSLSKNGGTLTALAAAATLTYIANGYYTLALTTGNTDTLGSAEISCNKATYQMPPREFMVLPSTVYDALTTNATTATGGLGDIQRMAGTALTARDIGASVLLSSGTGTGQLDFTSGVVKANATQWVGGTIPAVNITGVPLVDLKYTLGTISPAQAGSVAADWAATTNKTATANLSGTTINLVNTVTTVTNQLTGSAIATAVWTDTTAGDFTTALSIGKSIMNGVSLGTGLTINAYTGNTPQTGDAYARIGAAGAGLTSLGDTRIAHLDADVSSRMATYTQPTGFLAATFPTTVASTTNITSASGVALSAGGVTAVKAAITDATLAGANINTMANDYANSNILDCVVSSVTNVTAVSVGGITAASFAAGAITSTVAPNLDVAVSSRPTASAIATAWGSRVLGNSRTADMYLQGLTNRIAFAADGLSYTLYATDDTTAIATGTSTRLANTIGALRETDPA